MLGVAAGKAAVRQHGDFEVPVVGVAHGAFNGVMRADAADEQVFDFLAAQDDIQPGAVEGAEAVLG